MSRLDEKESTLTLPVLSSLEPEIGLVNPMTIVESDDVSELINNKANEFVTDLINVGDRELKLQRQYVRVIESIGDSMEKEIQRHSKLLAAPAKAIMDSNKESSSIDVSLGAIYTELKKIDPNGSSLSMSGFRSFLAKLPFVGDPLTNWVIEYLSVGQVIEEMTQGMKAAVAEMGRDNDVLMDDQVAMKEVAFKLEDLIRWSMIVDKLISEKISGDELSASKKKFLEEEILYALRQKTIGHQELQGINRQGVLVAEAVIRGNKELIRGFNNGIKTTMAAIRIASALAISLEKQGRNRKILSAINDYKGKLVRETGEKLLENTESIINEASTGGARIDDLKAGFEAALLSFDRLSEYKKELLPVLSQNITELEDVNKKLEKAVGELTEGSEEDIIEIGSVPS